MSPQRWFEAFRALGSAETHFARAVEIFAEGGFGADLEGYKQSMAFLHAMQAGHTSFEQALLKTLSILKEEPPSGPRWHRDLIARCAAEMPGHRPPILSPATALAADETRGFRSFAAHGYDAPLDTKKAAHAIAAAEIIVANARKELEAFRSVIDP